MSLASTLTLQNSTMPNKQGNAAAYLQQQQESNKPPPKEDKKVRGALSTTAYLWWSVITDIICFPCKGGL
jgi:hypothetical protein